MGSGTFLGSSSPFVSHDGHQPGIAFLNSTLHRPARGVLSDSVAGSSERRASVQTPTVYLVDNDSQVLESLTSMIHNMGFNVESSTSAEAFLDGFRDCPHSPKCIVAAIRLPGLSGLGLLRTLDAEGKHIPVIMISGCADSSMIVETMRAGALNFFEKPINSTSFSAGIREAIDYDIRQRREDEHKTVLTKQIDKLSSRQREVLDLLVAGEHTKQIANALGIGEKTVAKHRATVLDKLQVESVVDLVRIFSEAHLTIEVKHESIA